MITLRPLHDDEYDAWDAAHRAEYERGLVEHVGMPRAQAQAKVERDVSHVLPDGLATAGTHIWAVEDDARVVGTVFVGIRDGAFVIGSTDRGTVDAKDFLGDYLDFHVRVGDVVLMAKAHPSLRTPTGDSIYLRMKADKCVAIPGGSNQ